MVLGWERQDAGGVRCESATEGKPIVTPISAERRELRRVALAYLVESAAGRRDGLEKEETRGQQTLGRQRSRSDGDIGSTAAVALGEGGNDDSVAGLDGDETQLLPPNMYDVDRILAKTPLLRNDNAFHDTLNNDEAISCPYVLTRQGDEGEGIEAVVRFGKSIAGHPKIVHGGVTALTFDNLFGMALFLQGTGAVVTAYIKVDYKAPLPCLTTAVMDITIDRKEGRKLFVTGRLKSLDGSVTYSSAEALFIKPKEADPGAPGRAGGGSSGLLQGIVV
eukprot:g10081.t1